MEAVHIGDLQQFLAIHTAEVPSAGLHHHPINCYEPLSYDESGRLSCPHGSVPADDPRTRACLDLTVASLLFEVLD